MAKQNIRSKAMASARTDAHSRGPVSVTTGQGSPVQGRHRGVTTLVRHIPPRKRYRVATLNLGTLTGRSAELADALAIRRADLCAIKEIKWVGSKTKDLGKGHKLLYHGTNSTVGGVGFVVGECLRNAISEVHRYNDRLMKVVSAKQQKRIHLFSVYAPQMGCSAQTRDTFWSLLEEKVAAIPAEEMVVIAGDLSRHIGASGDGHDSHGGFGCGLRNEAGERILDFADGLSIVNTRFKKRNPILLLPIATILVADRLSTGPPSRPKDRHRREGFAV